MRPLLIASWNVLADCYSYGTGKPIVDFSYRSGLMTDIFTSLIQQDCSMFLLQEVDHYKDFFEPTFKSLGFESVYLQRPEREDGCLIAYDRRFALTDIEEVQFNDLVTGGQAFGGGGKQFSRCNVSLFAKFCLNEDKEKVLCVSSSHLYWNPNKPQVKLAQTRYLTHKFDIFRKGSSGVLAGDFNSLPDTDPYIEITTGQRVSSIYAQSDSQGYRRPRFLCDASLSRLCRWLRLLGFNSAMETSAQLEGRSKRKDFSLLYNQARSENRIIVTSSRSMIERAACPEAFYVETRDLTKALVDLCLRYEMQLTEENLLTVCGKCGGDIVAYEKSTAPESTVWPGDKDKIPEGIPVLICESCSQLYWWNETEVSSPAVAMRSAKEIYDKIKTAIPISMKIEEKEITSNTIDMRKLNTLFDTRVYYLNDKSSGSLVKDTVIVPTVKSNVYRSSFIREPLYTNWNGDFRGTLDYIFISEEVEVKHSEIISSSERIREHHRRKDSKGSELAVGPFPSLDWPSDHLLILTEINNF